jgi:hypothetical protein
MPLDPNTRRELTSREVANLLAGWTGVLATAARPESIEAALKHIEEHKSFYRPLWENAWHITCAANKVHPLDQSQN